ncbi:hypothetical protein DFA_06119 [Cavenderia fasciculata]|uniref:Uncharacterized protein n=1 Tax=Cavenderia fasciculata TaxID=261658 RepID=F4PK57_CACFS|nr:uncharacterized protein DFA_06119 [Cavenderia fasciculata]EGG23981.1 hypothetical protein DFA_06119 [Cavenderia fasciculata]|eukprot:XP_004361832.1 hypothetical protein DFA_06119 [Cavenderia fasciculata]
MLIDEFKCKIRAYNMLKFDGENSFGLRGGKKPKVGGGGGAGANGGQPDNGAPPFSKSNNFGP